MTVRQIFDAEVTALQKKSLDELGELFGIKARNKFQKNHTLNSYYNLGSRAYENAAKAEAEFEAEAHWDMPS